MNKNDKKTNNKNDKKPDNKNDKKKDNNQKDNKSSFGKFLAMFGVAALSILLVLLMFGSQPTEKYLYSDIIGYFERLEVKAFSLDFGTGKLKIQLRADAKEQNNYVEQESDSGLLGTATDKKGSDEKATEKPKEGPFDKLINGDTQKPTEPKYEGLDNLTKDGDKTNGKIITYIVPDVTVFWKTVTGDLGSSKGTNYLEAYNEKYPDAPMLYTYNKASDNGWLMELVPMLIMIVVLVAVWLFIMKKMTGGMGDPTKTLGFGKAKIKNLNDEKRKTTFDDVAGADEEKEDLEEIVLFLKDSSKFSALGARIPKGVLLVGPPGTGKTLLARAVAGEAGVPFFSISGSDFVEMFVGVGASRVRDLFDQAKKNSPCIIFIDEIDAVGRQRGAGVGGGNDEREQTLNQLLVEMDGFGINEGIIMIAATNRPDVLDPALLRPGRFDRQVVVNYPDIKGREQILKVHAKDKPLAPDVKLDVIAGTTAGFTGADLENLLNEAALLAARKDLKAITMAEIQDAMMKVVVGSEKKSKVMSEKEKKLTAYHEAGHAIAFYACPTQDPVHEISIIPRGMAGGYTMPQPSEDRSYKSKRSMEEDIVVCLGGRVAEALILDDISTGASNDIEKATETARAMVTRYGMSEVVGPINYAGGQEVFIGRDMGHAKDFSDATSAEIDKEVHRIITEAYDRTKDILTEYMPQLHTVAEHLMKFEKMNGDTFESIMNGTYVEPIDEPEEISEDISENTDNEAKSTTDVD
ncbi:MAG: ATP-dependent zinc metalloprotease FtsH [Acutalibacteraceae bacterium]|nr:ATP-dependent zinc metalloprotease FtsH [Acutalibacteraceae bacterium]